MGLRPPIHVGDFFTALGSLRITDVLTRQRVARLLGFSLAKAPVEGGFSRTEDYQVLEPPEGPKEQQVDMKDQLGDIPGPNEAWIEIDTLSSAPQEPEWFARVAPLPPTGSAIGLPELALEPLLERLWTRSILIEALARESHDGDLNLEEIVAVLAQGQALFRLSRHRQMRARKRVQIFVDTDEVMQPFEGDQKQLVDAVCSLLPSHLVEVARGPGSPFSSIGVSSAYPMPERDSTVLILSDLGLGVPIPSSRSKPWLWWQFLLHLTRRRCVTVIMFPYDSDRVPGSFRRLATFIPWTAGTTSREVRRLRSVSKESLP